MKKIIPFILMFFVMACNSVSSKERHALKEQINKKIPSAEKLHSSLGNFLSKGKSSPLNQFVKFFQEIADHADLVKSSHPDYAFQIPLARLICEKGVANVPDKFKNKIFNECYEQMSRYNPMIFIASNDNALKLKFDLMSHEFIKAEILEQKVMGELDLHSLELASTLDKENHPGTVPAHISGRMKFEMPLTENDRILKISITQPIQTDFLHDGAKLVVDMPNGEMMIDEAQERVSLLFQTPFKVSGTTSTYEAFEVSGKVSSDNGPLNISFPFRKNLEGLEAFFENLIRANSLTVTGGTLTITKGPQTHTLPLPQ